jgi:geranylgeranyl diphosphate synthase type II
VPDLDRVRRIHAGKTAAMMAVSLELGALAGGAPAADVAALSRAGRDFGLAFQIVDDLLDVEGSTAELGKQAGADAGRSKMTWPAVAGVEQSWRDARELVAGALDALPPGSCRPLLEALGATIVPRRS